jgi:hypothetical protein
MLVWLIRGHGAVRWMCRMCDTTACGRERGECPVGERYRPYGGLIQPPISNNSLNRFFFFFLGALPWDPRSPMVGGPASS